MGKYMHDASKKRGLKPGSLIHVGKPSNGACLITAIQYNENNISQRILKDISEIELSDHKSTWINIIGLEDTSVIESIGTRFNIHSLILEDILNTNQRPKIEEFDDYAFLVMKNIIYSYNDDNLAIEQLSLIIGSNYIITFQERAYEEDIFYMLRERLSNEKSKIRKASIDYLGYAIIDSLVDNYFYALENIEDKIELTESELISNPGSATLQNIYELKRKMLSIRKALWPLREIINILQRGEVDIIKDSTLVYLRDVYDHIVQIIDTIEIFRDIISGMLDTYLSSNANKTNEIMKVLTIFSTIFIPLSFIVGLYGMNFENMPEYKLPWAYPTLWVFMIFIVLIMFRYFRKNKWI
ncbi:MAG: magnesium/cobalt transporter CorA [Bacillota bacterium]|nr:magnesium/cobalt transporter CorA [Bacillota bacterium]